MIDFEEDFSVNVNDSALKTIAHLAQKQKELEKQVEEQQLVLKELEKELNRIQLKELPEAMEEAGISEFTTKDGTKISIKEDLKMSIPKKNSEDVAKWLQENDLESLIKTQLSFFYDSGESDKLNEVIYFLEKHGLIDFQLTESFNTSSVKAAVKELKEKGVDIPYKLLGGYEFRKSVLTSSGQ